MSTTRDPKKINPKKIDPKKVNNRLVNMPDGSWRNILSIYYNNRVGFDHVNFATLLSKLTRVSPDHHESMKQSKIYRTFLGDLSQRMTASEKLSDFGGVRGVASIVHSLAKLNDDSSESKVILGAVENNADWLKKRGNPQSVSMVTWALNKFKIPVPSHFQNKFKIPVPSHFHKRVEKSDERSISVREAIQINKRIIARASSWRDILSIYSAEHGAFDAINWVTLVNKLAAVEPREWASMKRSGAYRALLRDLSIRMTASDKLSDFGGVREVANIVHALAKLNLDDDIAYIILILRAVDSNAGWLVDSGDPKSISMAAWAFAELRLPAPALFEKIEEHSSSLVDNGSPRNIANTAWAFAKLQIPAPALFKKIDECASFLVEDGDTQDVSVTAWAFAQQKTPAPALFEKISEQASFLVENGSQQAVAMTAWAFATLNIPLPAPLKNPDKGVSCLAAVLQINERIVAQNYSLDNTLYIYHMEHESFNAVNWATIMMELAKVDRKVSESMKRSKVFRALLRDLSLRMTETGELSDFGDVRAVANIVYSLAIIRDKSIESMAIFSAVEYNAEWLLENGNPQSIANIAWAVGRIGGVPSPYLFQEIEKHASYLVENGSPQSISNTAWAFGKLKIPAPALFKKIDERASFLVENGTPQAIANTAWAVARTSLAVETDFHRGIDDGDDDGNGNGGDDDEGTSCESITGHDAWEQDSRFWHDKLENPAPALFQKIEEHASKFVENGTPLEIANTAWAFGALDIRSHALFEKIGEHASDLVENGNGKTIGRTAFAFEKLNIPAPSVLEEHFRAQRMLQKINSPLFDF
jgi:hypothetical protein